MGQKVNPHGMRVGVIKDWDSRWYASSEKVGDLLVEDKAISRPPRRPEQQHLMPLAPARIARPMAFFIARRWGVGDLLVEDKKIRDFLKKKLFNAQVPKIEIERSNVRIAIAVFTSLPRIRSATICTLRGAMRRYFKYAFAKA